MLPHKNAPILPRIFYLQWESLGIWQRDGTLIVDEARVGSVDCVGSVRHAGGDVNVTGKNLRLGMARRMAAWFSCVSLDGQILLRQEVLVN